MGLCGMEEEVEIKMVDIDKLKPCPWNSRKHPDKQINILIKSLKAYGMDLPVSATKDNMIITGHGIIKAAKKTGITKVPVVYSKLTGKEALARMLMDNKSAALGEDDYSKTADLLIDLDDGQFDLELTGFGIEEIQGIMEWTPVDKEKEWQGMPEFNQKDLSAWKSITVHFKNLDDLDEFAKLIKQPLTEKTRAIWYPKVEILRMDKVYKNES